MPNPTPPIDPSPILQTAFAFWSSKVLLTAVEFGVFTQLGGRRVTGAELGGELGLHPRGISDFFDALVAMKFLEREGDGAAGRYCNTPAGELYLDRNSPRYVGGILVMLNARLFKYWHDLPEALRTGKPQNEVKHGQKGIFEALYAELPKLEQFMGAMTGLSRINFEAFARCSRSARRSASPAAAFAAPRLRSAWCRRWRRRGCCRSSTISRRSRAAALSGAC